jgi:hypothetical protein
MCDAMDPTGAEYELAVRDHGEAGELLERVGALAEIRDAVISHCEATAPRPTYKPQAIKALLAKCGWVPEVRVPPYDSKHDDLPINERYDLYKVFDDTEAKVGVAIEIEKWEVWTDLLKFRRGLHRGQIAAGVILHDNPENLAYVFEHLRLLSEPLFGELPVVYCAPSGPGLDNPVPSSNLVYRPFVMP